MNGLRVLLCAFICIILNNTVDSPTIRRLPPRDLHDFTVYAEKAQ